MIQVQNVQQQPSQDVREQLYSQLEDYMGFEQHQVKRWIADAKCRGHYPQAQIFRTEQLEQQLQSIEQKIPLPSRSTAKRSKVRHRISSDGW